MTKHYNKIINNKIDLAIQALNNSKLVSFPTETVYGLGANAEDSIAVKKVFAAKNRPTSHPLIVHISHYNKIDFWAKNVSEDALKLAKYFWPGPLTLILPKSNNVLSEVTGGQNTVALRVPRHPVALSLLRKFNGLVGPSANRYGHVSPTLPEHVVEDLGDDIEYVVDGGPCSLGIESTVVNCCDGNVEILREGIISAAQISQILEKPILSVKKSTISSPGNKDSHYAPKKPLLVLPISKINSTAKKLESINKKYAVLSFHEQPKNLSPVEWRLASKTAISFARDLYNNLRNLDKLAIDCIVVEAVPDSQNWVAISDRLKRASFDSQSYIESLGLC